MANHVKTVGNIATVSVTDVRSNFSDVVKFTQTNDIPVYAYKNNEPVMVLRSVEQEEKLQSELNALRLREVMRKKRESKKPTKMEWSDDDQAFRETK